MNDNSTNPVDLAREVLAAEERHDGTPAHEADLREERWEFYEDLCTSNAPTLADAVIRLADLADELSEAGRESYQEGLDDAGDAYQAATLLIHAALKGDDR